MYIGTIKIRSEYMSDMSLLHGDCLELMKNIPDKSVDMVLTDPPYGMNYQSSRKVCKDERFDVLCGDEKPFIWFLHDAYRVLVDNSCMVCFSDWGNQDAFKFAIELAGFKIKSHIVWDRVIHGMGDLKGSFAPEHDIAWFATKGRYEFKGVQRPKSVFRHQRIAGKSIVHPTMKPVSLLKDILEPTTAIGDIVLDPFMGSGSTGVACYEMERKFVGIEKDEKYFETAKDRIQSVSDQQLMRF